MILKFVVENKNFFNIKQVAKEYFDFSDRLILKLKNKQLIFKNGSIAKINDILNIGDIIEFNLDYEEENDNILPSNIPLDIIFEDDSMIIVNKPPFLPIHPSIGHFDDSLSNAIKYYFNKINLHKKIRPVNRLDKDTSGLVIFAKNEYIQECLIKQMQNNIFKKSYLAVVLGNIKNETGTINLPISREENSIIKRKVNTQGQESITHYKVLKQYPDFSLVEFTLETGRTHQIRVHSSAIGHPLLGDTLYGEASNLINRQALHSYKIEFIHPISKEKILIESNLPEDIVKSLRNS